MSLHFGSYQDLLSGLQSQVCSSLPCMAPAPLTAQLVAVAGKTGDFPVRHASLALSYCLALCRPSLQCMHSILLVASCMQAASIEVSGDWGHSASDVLQLFGSLQRWLWSCGAGLLQLQCRTSFVPGVSCQHVCQSLSNVCLSGHAHTLQLCALAVHPAYHLHS